MPQHLKMSNKHVFCQLNITHQHYSSVKFQRRPKLKEVEIIEIDYKILHESEKHQKTST